MTMAQAMEMNWMIPLSELAMTETRLVDGHQGAHSITKKPKSGTSKQ